MHYMVVSLSSIESNTQGPTIGNGFLFLATQSFNAFQSYDRIVYGFMDRLYSEIYDTPSGILCHQFPIADITVLGPI